MTRTATFTIAATLAQVATKAAEKAAEQSALPATQHGQMRDLAASAARIFEWENDRPQNVFNHLVISQETKKIRALREPAPKSP